mmetsp:Transcript_16518/g.34060  ORF Transcript_16518/g.34060 Transcript_16518/m.34060 type:complete len:113 (-) Transcript_16518:162-500(-)|eukprot:CAMPEP_0197262756 /NCGR_PEP_ID=MMETSP1432-20130617/683_1 /TAXON_ID=44447 /ORGANISM="Pseudo-nitzschia delicatissima, Strain UNC1205" /LENGTH=112 /DNA_ID=CAMNT_0042727083 /DNA_START=287 /DNA_END=625 /DNA_ORIENTATION=+
MSSKKRKVVIDLTEGGDSETGILVKIKEEDDFEPEVRIKEEDTFEPEIRVEEEDTFEPGIERVNGVPFHLVKLNSLVEEFKCASWESPKKSKTMIKKMQKELKKLRKMYETV